MKKIFLGVVGLGLILIIGLFFREKYLVSQSPEALTANQALIKTENLPEVMKENELLLAQKTKTTLYIPNKLRFATLN